MKIRHDTPLNPIRFVCNSFMRGYMRKICSKEGACFLSNFVYSCLLRHWQPPGSVKVARASCPWSFARVSERILDAFALAANVGGLTSTVIREKVIP